jgi:long-chain acyl-CoA synthetase
MSDALPRHLAELLRRAASESGSKTGLLHKDASRKEWVRTTWGEAWGRALSFARMFEEAGVGEGDRVAIWSENRPEWLYADMGALALNAASVPVYATLAAPEVRHILADSGAKILVASKPEFLARLAPVLNELGALRQIVLLDGASGPAGRVKLRCLAAEPLPPAPDAFVKAAESRLRDADPSRLATLIYTSGTTGLPKGVMLTHGNFLANLDGVRDAISVLREDLHLSFLPLSHVFERLCGFYLPVLQQAAIAYAESIDAVAQNLLEIRPTMILGVPRFYEKIHNGILEHVGKMPAFRRAVFGWALRRGELMSRALSSGRRPGALERAAWRLADALVFRKIRGHFGGRVRLCVSGSAPLGEALARFFHAFGILIIEGYGLTETSPVISCNRSDRYRFGTVGIPLKNAEVRIADDGEILTRGPCVMKGYHGLEAATREALEGGWFHTGDLGAIDADGFLAITGRKKEILVTSGGKKISPQTVEPLFEAEPLIRRCFLYGDGRNFLTALIVPNFEALAERAAERGEARAAAPELVRAPWVKEEIRKAIDRVHARLASFEQIKYFELLDRDFSVAEGELTPTLKVRRPVIAQKYGRLLEPFYAPGAP